MASIAPDMHNRRDGVTDSWITPKWLLDRIAPFDLDPCASDPQPWATAGTMFTETQDGLLLPWTGFVFCNPPYGRALESWLQKMANHNNGIALVFARTETGAFHKAVWPFASSLLFLKGRLFFCRPDGTPAEHNSGAPSVLIAYGAQADAWLRSVSDLGTIVAPCR